MLGIFGRKIGMTQVFDEKGVVTPVTVVKFEKHCVLERKTKEKHGYLAVVFATEEENREKLLSKPVLGRFKKVNQTPRRKIFEVRDFDLECEISQEFDVSIFENIAFVDVTGISKGKGMQGVMKKWNFQGGRKTHGSKFHREAGSTGQSAQPSRTFKGHKMPGRMGFAKKTCQNAKLMSIDKENNLIVVKGSLPGSNGNYLFVKQAKKKVLVI